MHREREAAVLAFFDATRVREKQFEDALGLPGFGGHANEVRHRLYVHGVALTEVR